jgi:adenine phosphoribosyltransferase
VNLNEALALIRPVPDFPVAGILFQDISPLLANPEAFKLVTAQFSINAVNFDYVAGIEARGFILASAVAVNSSIGFIPIRKAGKLPGQVIARSYGLEYGSDSLEIQANAFSDQKESCVLLIDDVLATGGTIIAALELITELGQQVHEVSVLLEISSLNGRSLIEARFPDLKITALVTI